MFAQAIYGGTPIIPIERKPKKNCKRCLGRGSVTLILAKDEAGNDVKETKPCVCLSRVSDNNWPEKKR